MSNNKQSSIDYLLDHLHYKDSLKWAEVIEQAKAMHKEEIKDAYYDGSKDFPIHESTCEQYYNETYGGNNE